MNREMKTKIQDEPVISSEIPDDPNQLDPDEPILTVPPKK